MEKTLFRDDDINVRTDLTFFMKVHREFIKQRKIHTCAVLFKDLADNYELFHYLVTAPYLSVELHGWEHKDYSTRSKDNIKSDFMKAISYWKENVTRRYSSEWLKNPLKKITTFYPPWNKVNDDIKKVCKELGLKLDNRKGGSVLNFHYWSEQYPLKQIK